MNSSSHSAAPEGSAQQQLKSHFAELFSTAAREKKNMTSLFRLF